MIVHNMTDLRIVHVELEVNVPRTIGILRDGAAADDDSAAGTLYVKDSSGITKAYVCIFTCASSQMVHLELTKILTTDKFLQAFDRVVSRRGVCGTTRRLLKLRVRRLNVFTIEVKLCGTP